MFKSTQGKFKKTLNMTSVTVNRASNCGINEEQTGKGKKKSFMKCKQSYGRCCRKARTTKVIVFFF